MKAAQVKSYGDPEVIQVNQNAPEPTLKPGQILVENYAASINPFDSKLREGFMKDSIPLQFPYIPGGDFSGVVTKVSDDVSEFKLGDEIFGSAITLNGGSGAFAEVAAANVKNTSLKPKTVDFVEAASLPLVASSAVQALETHIKLQKGQKILIHGGAGGIGHVAIQLAKALGAYVATTVKAEDMEFVKGLGVDEAIDYKSQQFEQILKDYDSVFDTVGGETSDRSFKVLKKGGTIVSMLGQPNQELALQHQVTAIGQMTQIDKANLNRLVELVDSGKIKVHVGKVFPLEEAQAAFTYQEKVHPRGKVAIKIR